MASGGKALPGDHIIVVADLGLKGVGGGAVDVVIRE